MNTTALFVEFIIIGSGAMSWLGLLFLSLFGYAWIHWDKVTSVVVEIWKRDRVFGVPNR